MSLHPKSSSHRRDRRGATIVAMAFLMIVVIGTAAFGIDVGLVCLTRAQMQRAIDAGAIAASLELTRNPAALDQAAESAEDFIQRNRVGMAVTIPEDAIQVEIGTWDADTKQFVTTTSDPDAVRVFATQADEPFFFGRVFGKTSFSVLGAAIATGSGSSVDIMLVLDLSGSMEDEGRIEALHNSAPVFVDVIEEIGRDDHIGVMGLSADPSYYDPAGFGDSGYLYEPAGLNPGDDYHVGVVEADMTSDFNNLRDFVLTSSNLEASKYGGWTGIGGCIRDAAHYLTHSPHSRAGVPKIIVLMSDGAPTKPETPNPTNYAMDQAHYARDLNVVIYTISLGNGAPTGTMQAIASVTKGIHFNATGSGESELTTNLTEAFKQAAEAVRNTQLVK